MLNSPSTMGRDAESAKDALLRGSYTCVVVKNGAVRASDLRGIAPMVEFIDSEIGLRGSSAADRIVGKAAALLFALAGVSEVYATVMSSSAIAVLERFGVAYSYDTLTETITNRQGTGPCPMEAIVADIEEPLWAYGAIAAALEESRAKEGAA